MVLAIYSIIVIETGLHVYKTLHTFTGTGYDTSKELAGEIFVILVAALPLLRPVCGLSSSSMTSTSVPWPDVLLAFFLGGAAAAAVLFILVLNARCFWFLMSGIVFEGRMSAILSLN